MTTRLELPCPEAGRSFVVRLPTSKQYWEYFDETRARPDDAAINFLIRIAEEPVAYAEVLRALPGLPDAHSVAVEEHLGANTMKHERLRRSTTPEEFGAFGLDEPAVVAARASHPLDYDLGMVRAVFLDASIAPKSFIVRRPSQATFQSLQQPKGDAVIAGVLDCAVFPPREALATLLEELPAIAVGLRKAILTTGGAFAEVKAKKL